MLPGISGLMGASVVTSDAKSFAPGDTTWTVPDYVELEVEVAGGGGGADNGGAGADSIFSTVRGLGGASGWYGVVAWLPVGGGYLPINEGRAGAPGAASGGDANTTGGAANGGAGAGPGGAGGLAKKKWIIGVAGAPVPGTTIKVTVGAGAGNGGAGRVTVNWK